MRRIHYAWVIAAVTFIALMGAAGFRSTPAVLIVPLEHEFGWNRAVISVAVSINLILFGLTGPFAAALMDRFGLRAVTVGALITVASGALLTTLMTSPWELYLLWGVVVGLGTGCMASVLAATVAGRSRDFWLLAGSFFICGASTTGLIGTHLIPASIDHGMAEVTAASLLAVIGVFDVVGTLASGYLTDRFDSRLLLFIYYALRGGSLLLLPYVFGSPQFGLILFIVFYGLDWVATVPPTVQLARKVFGQQNFAIVYGWIFAAHQLGAATIAFAAGAVRTYFGDYQLAFMSSGLLCLVAAGLVLRIARTRPAESLPAAAEAPAYS